MYDFITRDHFHLPNYGCLLILLIPNSQEGEVGKSKGQHVRCHSGAVAVASQQNPRSAEIQWSSLNAASGAREPAFPSRSAFPGWSMRKANASLPRAEESGVCRWALHPGEPSASSRMCLTGYPTRLNQSKSPPVPRSSPLKNK